MKRATPLLLVILSTLAAESPRERIEADWAKQDTCRMALIEQPGLVRFVESELDWSGVARDVRTRVPSIAEPVIDGTLNDPGWTTAVQIEPTAESHPTLRLGHHGDRLYFAASFATENEPLFRGSPTALDAAGAVDGVKDGKYAFHTNAEPNPWWQVDLGRSCVLGRIVVYNRLDYAPGLHNADKLLILTSDDGVHWTQRYDNQGRHFDGVTGVGPLELDGKTLAGADGQPVTAQFVRFQINSPAPIFLHLDEVEIYATGDPAKNVALNRPARQSSLSIWSQGQGANGSLALLGRNVLRLDADQPDRLLLNDRPLGDGQAVLRRESGETFIEAFLPLDTFAAGFPTQLTPPGGEPIALARGANWSVTWDDTAELGFGANRIALNLTAAGPLASPVEFTVESVVFTPQRPERSEVVRRRVDTAGVVTLELDISHEGPAAVIISAADGQAGFREGRSFFIPPAAETLQRARRLADEFQTALPEDVAAEIASLEARLVDSAAGDTRQELYRQARWLARRVAFANPRLDFEELVVLKRFTQETYPDVCLNHMPWCSRPGGDISVVTLGAFDGDCKVRNVINGQLGPGHVHGMSLWWDADRIVFGYAKSATNEPPEGWLDRRTNFDLRRQEEPTHLFEIRLDSTGLRQLTSGEWSDLDPTYLADGRVAFVSERCGCSLQCNEYDKDETSCNLYVMGPDGDNIRQLSVTKDGDYLPHALDDGTIAYTRWEYQERSFAHIQSVWTIRPDGTFADALYKQHMNNPWALEDMRSIPESKKLVAVATGHHTLAVGPLVVIDPHQGMNREAGLRIVTPGVNPPEGGMVGTPVDQGGVPGAGGFYSTPWALSENTFLTSYTYGPERDPAGYAVYLVDTHGTKELVYRDPEISCFMPIPLRPRRTPPMLADSFDPAVPYATCMVSNIARGVPDIDPQRIRYLRISQRLLWPYSNTDGGERYEPDVKSVLVNWTPARVIGTVPIEADGSAHFQVPVDTPVYFQLLDENHMELRRMRSFISFHPGENRGCVGCHETREEAPVMPVGVFPMAAVREASIPEPPPWGTRPISFLRDVQPVFDRHCVECHAGLDPAGGLDFSAGLTASNNRCYDTITAAGLISRSDILDDAKVTPPLAFGSHRSSLVETLREGPCSKRTNLSEEDWLRLVVWIDANGPYHDAFINKRQPQSPYNLPGDRELLAAITEVHGRRCASCHDPADVSRLDWVDLTNPGGSRFLTAPLASDKDGGCGRAVYTNTEDPDYAALSATVEAAVKKAWRLPRRDLKAFRDDERPLATR